MAGLSIENFPGFTNSDAIGCIEKLFEQAIVKGGTNGAFQNYVLKEQLPNIDLSINSDSIDANIVKHSEHWINSPECMEVLYTDKIRIEDFKTEYEGYDLQQTAGFSNPRMGKTKRVKRMTESDKYQAGFELDGEAAEFGGMREIATQGVLLKNGGVQTMAMRTYHFLLRCRQNQSLERARNYMELVNRMQVAAEMCFGPHKTHRGAQKLAFDMISEMELSSYERHRPTAFIVPYGKMMLAIAGSTETTDYKNGGPYGQELLHGDGKMRTLADVPIKEAPMDFADGRHLQNSTRRLFVTAGFWVLEEYPGMKPDPSKGPTIEMLDIYTSRKKAVSFEECLKCDPRFTSTGGKFTPSNRLFVGSNGSIVPETLSVEEWSKKIGFILLRICRSDYSQPMVAISKGLGITNYGDLGFKLSYDNGVNMYTGVQRARIGHFLTDNGKLVVRQNVFYAGVGKGGNVKLINEEEARKISNEGFRAETENSPSIYVMSYLKENFQNDEFMFSAKGPLGSLVDKGTLDRNTHEFYNEKYGFDILPEETIFGCEEMPVSNFCYREPFRYMNESGTYIEVAGQGPHGAYEEGDARKVHMYGKSVNSKLMT